MARGDVAQGHDRSTASRCRRTPRFQKAALIPQATDALAAEANERGKRVILILDEAHLLDGVPLEELRLLTSAEMDSDSRSPGAVLLIGHPTLRRRIKLGAFAALDQRIALRYAMTGMDPTPSR